MKSRKWFLTINNWCDEEWQKCLVEIKDTEYGICCKEVGAQGTPHLHLWLRYKNARTFKSIQKKFNRANIQEGKGRDSDQKYLKKDNEFEEFGTMEKQGKRNDIEVIKDIVKKGGTMSDIISESTSYQSMKCGELLLKYNELPRDSDQKYLKKDHEFEEFGTMEKQGKRNDIEVIKDIVKKGGTMSDIISESTSYQSMKCGELLLKYNELPREIEKIEVIWYYGESGSGKTKSIFDTEVNIFRPTTYKWWEGYDGHSVVLIDDFRPTFCSFVNLLKLTDIYPFRVQTKGGSRQVKYKKIYITSHLSPAQYYEELDKGDYLQLKRRITCLKCFDTEVKG